MTRRALTLALFVLFSFLLLAAQSPTAPVPEDKKQKKENAVNSAVFDERTAAAVLGTIRDGLEGHSQRRLLSAFDRDKMDGFLTFEDQIDAYFTDYQSFRVSMRIVQTSEENNRGVILADFQIENTPRGGGPVSSRQAQLRFELERGSKGWKIVDFNPRTFFS